MYLHLGNGIVVRKQDILGIFDIDNTTQSYLTRDYLNRAEKDGQVTSVAQGELPKSFVVCAEKDTQQVFVCQLNSSTLQKRSESINLNQFEK